MTNEIKSSGSSNKKLTLQNSIYFFVILDFVVSMIGGVINIKYPDLANKMFMAGGFFLSIAIVLIIIEIISRKK